MEIPHSFVSLILSCVILSNASFGSKHESDANKKLGKLEKTAGDDRLNSLIEGQRHCGRESSVGAVATGMFTVYLNFWPCKTQFQVIFATTFGVKNITLWIQQNCTSDLEERDTTLEIAVSAIEDELGETSAEIDDLQTADTVINVRLLEVETDIFNTQNSIDGKKCW